MTETERQLRASLAHEDGRDADFVASMRLVVDARPLSPTDASIGDFLSVEDASHLVRLAEEALAARRRLRAAPQSGPRGTVVSVVASDDRNRFIAKIEFEDEDQVNAAGALLARPVTLERAFDIPKAANAEPGHGSEEDDD